MSPEVFSQDRIVEPADLDDQGHVSNIAFVRFIQDAAVAHWDALEEQLRSRAQPRFVVHRHEIVYLQRAFVDERLRVSTHVAAWRGASCDRHTRILRVSDGILLTRAVTVWAYVNLETGRPSRIPAAIREAFDGVTRR